MLTRKHVGLVTLILGLSVPAFAQPRPAVGEASEGSAARSQKALSAHDDEQYRHLDNEEEDQLLDAGPAETDEKTLEFLRINEPEMSQEMVKLKTSDLEEYKHALIMESHHVRALEDLQTDDPEGFRVTIADLRAYDRVGSLAHTCRSDGRADKTELKVAVEQLFEARQARERHQLDLARQDVDQWNKDLQARQAKRASIVDHYIHEVTVPDSERW